MQPLADFFFNIIRIIDVVLVPIIFSVAFIIFLWGAFRFFIAGGADKEKREEGKKFMFWAVIGFVLMFSIWGIVNMFMRTLGFGTDIRPTLPLLGGQPPHTPTVQGGGWFQGGFGGGNGGGQFGGGQQQGNSFQCSVLNFWQCPDGHMCRSNQCVPRPPSTN